MIGRILREKNFVACVLATVTGIVLYFRYPFPEQNFFLELIFLWARPVFQGLKFCYTLFLYTTPYIIYSFLLSGLYIFTLKSPPRPKAGNPPAYPGPSNRTNLFLVLGEVHLSDTVLADHSRAGPIYWNSSLRRGRKRQDQRCALSICGTDFIL